MTLENTFTATSEIGEPAAPAWDAMPDAIPDADIDAMTEDVADDAAEDMADDVADHADAATDDVDAAAGDRQGAGAGPAGEPRGERQAVVIDEFDPTLSFRDAKERAIGLWERWYVAELLRHTGGNLSEAARVAHSDRSHLRKLVRKHLRSAITPP